MPMHDWTRVEAGIYHHFHHEWISIITREVNNKLPSEFYALAEQYAGGLGPDVLALHNTPAAAEPDSSSTGNIATLAQPITKLYQESDSEFYLGKQSTIAIRHVSGDRVVAMIEIVSPGNKNTAHGIRKFVSKVQELLNQNIHMLVIDPFPVGPRDPNGLHSLIFSEYENSPIALPAGSPLSLVAYECTDTIRAYIEPYSVSEKLIDMPIYLYPGMYINIALESTYMTAWEAVPRRWRDVIAK